MAVTLADLTGTAGGGGLIETDLSDASLEYHLLAAIELVEHEAPMAPQSILDEATIRVVGWFVNQPMSSQRSQRVGEFSQGFMVGGEATNVIRVSGAGRLLSPYKVRRGGAA